LGKAPDVRRLLIEAIQRMSGDPTLRLKGWGKVGAKDGPFLADLVSDRRIDVAGLRWTFLAG
jgi:hypothetical protein